MNNKKQLIPCVYLQNEKLVKGFNDNVVVSEDPVAYIVNLAVNGADGVIIFDLSTDDLSHENALVMIRKITSSAEIFTIGAGNVKRLEDVKKLIYAGCDKVLLNMSKQTNVDLIEEASKRFGKDKIMACAENKEQISCNLDALEKYASGCVMLNCTNVVSDKLPVIAVLDGGNLKDIFANNISAVSGDIINDKDLIALKKELESEGIKTELLKSPFKWDELKKDANGLIPVIVQDIVSNEVLMLAYMNEESFNMTLDTGIMTYYSRSRSELWKKGDTSGHYQYVKNLSLDCDKDTILAKVIQIGNACHTGARSCFFNEVANKKYDKANPYTVLEDVYNVIMDRKANPKEGSYTNYLFDKGIDKILKKVGEEATEIVIAAKNPEPEESKYEIADFLYHAMVLMALKGITWEDVIRELANR